MVPNNVVLSAAVVPLREPASVDLRARLRPDVMPSEVQSLLEEAITTPVRGEPHIALEEIDREEVVVRVAATPVTDADGPRLADEILGALSNFTRDIERVRMPEGVDVRADRVDAHADRVGARADRDDALGDAGARGAGRDERSLDGERDGRRHEPVTQEYES
jgi:hypothetical protein